MAKSKNAMPLVNTSDDKVDAKNNDIGVIARKNKTHLYSGLILIAKNIKLIQKIKLKILPKYIKTIGGNLKSLPTNIPKA